MKPPYFRSKKPPLSGSCKMFFYMLSPLYVYPFQLLTRQIFRIDPHPHLPRQGGLKASILYRTHQLRGDLFAELQVFLGRLELTHADTTLGSPESKSHVYYRWLLYIIIPSSWIIKNMKMIINDSKCARIVKNHQPTGVLNTADDLRVSGGLWTTWQMMMASEKMIGDVWNNVGRVWDNFGMMWDIYENQVIICYNVKICNYNKTIY